MTYSKAELLCAFPSLSPPLFTVTGIFPVAFSWAELTEAHWQTLMHLFAVQCVMPAQGLYETATAS
jgi:hypothetical protein